MNTNEARMKIHGAITEVLTIMAAEDDTTEHDLVDLEDQMAELADVLMEDLGVEVQSVNEDGSINVVLRLFSDEIDDETA